MKFSHTHPQKEYKIEEHKNRGAKSVCILLQLEWKAWATVIHRVHFRGVMFSSSCTMTVAQN